MSSETRIFPVDTNFQQMARRPGGMSRDRAIERAEVEITDVRAGFDEWLSRELTELAMAFTAARNNRDDDKWLAAFKERSRQLCEVTATMRFELLAFVAESLCGLLDSIGSGAELPIDPIVCHLDALSLSARPDFRALRPDQVPELTKGLRRVAKQAHT
jgi:hypothetical protein